MIYAGPHYERNVGTGATTADVATKLYFARLGPLRRLIAVRKAGVLSYLHHDHLGSTKRVSGTTGGPMKYYPFGSTYQEPANPPTDNLYTGQKRDLSTGLYYYGARYVDVATGRFTQPDSIVPQPGDPQSLNRYAYALNNPLKYADPTGHFFFVVIGLVVVGGAAVAWLSHPSTANAPSDEGLAVKSDEWASTKAGMSASPGTGDINDFVSFATGRDQLTGEDLGPADRALTGSAAILPFIAGPVVRQGVKGVSDIVLDMASGPAITAYRELKGLGKEALQAHHALEQRFSRVLGQKASEMLAIAADSGAHRRLTNEWRKAIGYVGDKNPLNTATATLDDILLAARDIYKNMPEVLRRIEEQLGR